jgi:hypothetical protein
MTLIGLLIAVLVTAVLVWLVQQGHIPAPFTWIVYAVLVVVWLIVLLQVTGVAGRFDFGRISQLAPIHTTVG